VAERYKAAEIGYRVEKAEGFTVPDRFTECWIYNVLQHVVDPERVIEAARACAYTLRIFDWLETPAAEGHPHTLHAHDLNRWIGGSGQVAQIDENGAVGLAYYGFFDLRIRAADNGAPDWTAAGVPGEPGIPRDTCRRCGFKISAPAFSHREPCPNCGEVWANE
jgi:hypothetical protein